jgi:TPR repeat protein
MYDAGRGVLQDHAEAAKWLQKAADQGNANAQYDLGIAYFKGLGVPQDYAIAYMWLNLGATGGNKNAAKFRDALTSNMTPAQIAEAQRLARDWKPGQK